MATQPGSSAQTQRHEQEQHDPTLQGQGGLDKAQEAAAASPGTQLINRAVSAGELLSPFTVACLIVNRTIASGIFTQPYNVVSGVGNSGASLLVWFVAGIIVLCITACWVELGLSIPRHVVGQHQVSTPKSGGDKNYLEYIFKKPEFLMSCVFGISFLVFGNLAGNAIQFGVYMQAVVDPTCQDECVKSGPVVAWAVGVLTLCAFTNVATRRFSIRLNNIFAVLKISLVVLMIFIGTGYGSAHGGGCSKIVWENKGEGGAVGDVVLALFYAMYPYTGYEQPFYVLAEVRQPKTRFSKSVMYTMSSFIVLYALINTSYLCMNPYLGPNIPSSTSAAADPRSYFFTTNAAIDFFYKLSSGNANVGQDGVVRGVSFLLALFIFGNLLAQTYTASRVKQEIAKEGILPYSLLLAKSNDTLAARWFPPADAHTNPEQAPFAATALHYGFEVFLVLVVGLPLSPNKAYNFLTYLYTFVVVGLLGFLTVCGLLYLKMDSWLSRGVAQSTSTAGQRPLRPGRGRGRRWEEKREWFPWLDPLPCVVAVLALAFLLFGAFAEPSNQETDEVAWWVMPLVGWLCLLVGMVWWCGLELQQWMGGYRIERSRITYVEALDDEDLVQTAELVVVKRRYATETRPVDGGLPGVWD